MAQLTVGMHSFIARNIWDDWFFKGAIDREIKLIKYHEGIADWTVVFSDSLYPEKEFTKVMPNAFLSSGVPAHKISEFFKSILDHDGGQDERDRLRKIEDAKHKAKEHPTGEVLLMLLDEIQGLRADIAKHSTSTG